MYSESPKSVTSEHNVWHLLVPNIQLKYLVFAMVFLKWFWNDRDHPKTSTYNQLNKSDSEGRNRLEIF